MEMFSSVWKNPFLVEEELTNISTGASPSQAIQENLMNDYAKGEEACAKFILERISKDRDTS